MMLVLMMVSSSVMDMNLMKLVFSDVIQLLKHADDVAMTSQRHS